MEKSRLHYSILNSSVTVVIQVVNIFIKFLLQTVLIKELGATFVGINGLFTNILTMLSFAELGIGPAIVYSLYKPLAKKNEYEISALMKLFSKSYNFIGIIIGVIGTILLPIIPWFVKNGSDIANLRIYFFLFVLNSALSYFFTYKRSLLIADQKNYISAVNQFIFNLLQTVLQIGILFELKNYLLFLIIQVLCTFSSNVMISFKVDKAYPFLKNFKNAKVNVETISTIKKNIVGMMGSKFGTVIIFGTDNLLISTFLGIVKVGIYSNYSLIVTAVTNVLTNAVNSVTSSIGNLTVSASSQKVKSIFLRHLFINFLVTLFSSSLLLGLLNPFISFWIGKNYLLSSFTVEVIVINFALNQMRQTAVSFIGSYGLFWKVGIKSIIEAIVNLVLSLIFIYFLKLGIAGTILGSVMTNICINTWWEPRLVIKEGIKIPTPKYFAKYILYMFLIVVCSNLSRQVILSLNGIPLIAQIMIGILISIFVCTSCVLIIFFKSDDLMFFLQIIKKLILSKRENKNE